MTCTKERYAVSDLQTFCELMYPKFDWTESVVKSMYCMEDCLRIESSRLIIFDKPSYGMDMLASHVLPAWYIGRNPDKLWLQICRSEGYARYFAQGHLKSLMSSDKYKAIFPEATLNVGMRGNYYATGVGSVLAGIRPDVVCIDRVEETATWDSIVRMKEWYSDVLRLRIIDSSIILVSSEGGLAEHVLSNHHNENWLVVDNEKSKK